MLGGVFLKMKSAKKIILVALVAFLPMGAAYLKRVDDYQRKVKEIAFSQVDVSLLADGEYLGESDVGFISAKVRVVVKDGKILAIDLLGHKNERGKEAEKITVEMVKKQTTAVDAVSGATNSAKVIRKAVENALLGK